MVALKTPCPSCVPEISMGPGQPAKTMCIYSQFHLGLTSPSQPTNMMSIGPRHAKCEKEKINSLLEAYQATYSSEPDFWDSLLILPSFLTPHCKIPPGPAECTPWAHPSLSASICSSGPHTPSFLDASNSCQPGFPASNLDIF